MADNYLEKKFEEMREGKNSKVFRKRSPHLSLDSLLLKNRSCRGYDENYIVTEDQLKQIIEVNTKTPSARNQQVLRFLPIFINKNNISAGPDCGNVKDNVDFVNRNIKLGAALPHLHLPFKGTEPNAFIIIFSTVPENKWVDVDLGISCQSMLLKAVELGLNGICIGAFNKEQIASLIDTEATLEPIMIIAIGKSIEKIQLLPIKESESHNYFRENGVHFVPKLTYGDIVIKEK